MRLLGLKSVLAVSLLPALIWSAPVATNLSSIVGRVLHASDSTPAIGASIILAGGSLDAPRFKVTDNNGYYRFDSIAAGIGYNIAASAAGYTSASISNVSPVANSIDTVVTLYLTRNLGMLTGFVSRSDSTNIVLKNAKMVFFVNGLKTDSTYSDSLGRYSITLNAATYIMKSSLAGYRSNKGLLTRDTTVTVNFGQTTTSFVYLTPATGTINGTISHNAMPALAIQSGPIASASVYLERRMGSVAGYSLWILIDSAITDGAGLFVFTGLIPATTTPTVPPATGISYSASGGNYRLLVKALGYIPNYDTCAILTSTAPTGLVDLPYIPNSVVTAVANLNANLPVTTGMGGCTTDTYGFDNQHLGNSKIDHPRILEIYDMNGILHKTILVPAGESKIEVPSAFARGFLLLMK